MMWSSSKLDSSSESYEEHEQVTMKEFYVLRTVIQSEDEFYLCVQFSLLSNQRIDLWLIVVEVVGFGKSLK